MEPRNANMIRRIEATPVEYPFRFTFLADNGATPNPVGDAIFSEILRQIDHLEPKPLFCANLGDFAGPGTLDRHHHYLRLVEKLTIPNICLIGNHDQDDDVGLENFKGIHGPVNFRFTYGRTEFFAMTCNKAAIERRGPGKGDLEFLEAGLRDCDRPSRVVLMHQPPNLDGHYNPHPELGFLVHEREFLELIETYGVRLVCCGHVIAYDCYRHKGIPIVASGGGGWGLYFPFSGPYTSQQPPHRGVFYNFVEITVQELGAISGRVISSF